MKDDNKVNGSLIVIVLLILVICGLCGFICYDKIILEKSEDKDILSNYESGSRDDVSTDVPVEDTYAVDFSVNEGKLNVNYFLLDNGKLYYKSVSNIDANFYHSYDFGSYMNNNKDLNEFDGLTNIKRIKGANTISTGVAFNLILISTDGKVYEFVPDGNVLTQNKYLKDYSIDDISEYNTVNGCINSDESVSFVTCGASYKFTTIDGKSHDVKLNTDGTISEN